MINIKTVRVDLIKKIVYYTNVKGLSVQNENLYINVGSDEKVFKMSEVVSLEFLPCDEIIN